MPETSSIGSAKKTNEWVLNTAGMERSLLASVKERKIVYFGYVMRKKGDSLEKCTYYSKFSKVYVCQNVSK